MKLMPVSKRTVQGLIALEHLLIAMPFLVYWSEVRWRWVDDQTISFPIALLLFWGSLVLAGVGAVLLLLVALLYYRQKRST